MTVPVAERRFAPRPGIAACSARTRPFPVLRFRRSERSPAAVPGWARDRVRRCGHATIRLFATQGAQERMSSDRGALQNLFGWRRRLHLDNTGPAGRGHSGCRAQTLRARRNAIQLRELHAGGAGRIGGRDVGRVSDGNGRKIRGDRSGIGSLQHARGGSQLLHLRYDGGGSAPRQGRREAAASGSGRGLPASWSCKAQPHSLRAKRRGMPTVPTPWICRGASTACRSVSPDPLHRRRAFDGEADWKRLTCCRCSRRCSAGRAPGRRASARDFPSFAFAQPERTAPSRRVSQEAASNPVSAISRLAPAAGSGSITTTARLAALGQRVSVRRHRRGAGADLKQHPRGEVTCRPMDNALHATRSRSRPT